ncbi:MAG: serine/threonine-protein kinase [Polyangiaceae bacterium]
MTESRSAERPALRDVAELGQGGMGEVFLTIAPRPDGTHELLVHKRLRDMLASDPEFLRIFLNEARLSARLRHPNIVETYEVGFDGSSHYIAMEYLDGQPMHRILRRARHAGPFTLEMQLRVIADMLGGLHHAHELCDYDGVPLAIVHRDVSPANIFVCYDGQVKLVDFGIAKSTKSGETQVGVFKGKIQYVSPEQYKGEPLDRRADIYSTGVLLWEAATGRRMWKDAGDVTVIQRVAAGDVPLPSSVNPDVDPRLEAICMKALAVDRNDRYPTAAALQIELEAFLLTRETRILSRDVGAAIEPLFAEERAHLKVLIEDQLRAAREADTVSIAPTVTLPEGASTVSVLTTEVPVFAAITENRSSRHALPVAAGAVALLFAAVYALTPSSAPPRGSPSTAPAALQPEPSAHAVAPPPAPSAEVPAPPPAPPPVASAPPPSLKITVQTVPEDARVTVDGALLPSDGQLEGFTRDNAVHKIRAEAPGYRAKAEWVRFDTNDVSLRLTLEKKPRKDLLAPDPAPRGNGAAAASSESGVVRDGPPSNRPRAIPPPLDTADPWKK